MPEATLNYSSSIKELQPTEAELGTTEYALLCSEIGRSLAAHFKEYSDVFASKTQAQIQAEVTA